MALDDQTVFGLLRSGQADELYRRLDAELEADPSLERRHLIAHWRSHAFVETRRYEDGVDHLRRCRDNFFCKTSAHSEAAELLDWLGRNAEAQAELEPAPFAAEAERFPVLVADARFMLLLIKVRGGYCPSDQELDAFPDDFGTVILPGRPFMKNDLLALVAQRRPRQVRWTFD